MTKHIGHIRPLEIWVSEYLYTYLSSLILMVNQEGMSRHFLFEDISGPKANNWGKCLILFVKVLFIWEEWLSPLTFLKTGLLSHFCSERLLRKGKNAFQWCLSKFSWLQWQEIREVYPFLSTEYFSLAPYH